MLEIVDRLHDDDVIKSIDFQQAISSLLRLFDTDLADVHCRLIKKLIMIVARPARLVECAEFKQALEMGDVATASTIGTLTSDNHLMPRFVSHRGWRPAACGRGALLLAVPHLLCWIANRIRHAVFASLSPRSSDEHAICQYVLGDRDSDELWHGSPMLANRHRAHWSGLRCCCAQIPARQNGDQLWP